jgi:hypothetical protein
VKRSPLRRRTGLKAESDKTRGRRNERADAVAAAFARDRWRCRAERLVPEVRCGGKLEGHEPRQRSVAPGSQYDVNEIVTICRVHHRWIDDHEIEATRRGLLLSSWQSIDEFGKPNR